MPTPSYIAVTDGDAFTAGQINQYLGTHDISYIYAGASVNSNTGTIAAYDELYDQAVAQSFFAASTGAVGWITLWARAASVGSDVIFSIQPDSGGSGPTGTVLGQTLVPADRFSSDSAGAAVTFPIPVTGLTPGDVYWVCASMGGSSVSYVELSYIAAHAGLATSAGGSAAWSISASTSLYFDISSGDTFGNIYGTWEDDGARWTWITWVDGLPTDIYEYVLGSAPGNEFESARVVTYAGVLPVAVA